MPFLAWRCLAGPAPPTSRPRAFLLQAPPLGRTSLHPIAAANLLFLGITAQQKRTPARLTLGRANGQGLVPYVVTEQPIPFSKGIGPTARPPVFPRHHDHTGPH